MKTVTVYTDGACSGNPGPGGWAAILQYNGAEKVLSGGEAQTTNNRMELLGVISALEALKEPCRVELYSDSKYVIDALQKRWVWGWKAKGWIKSDKKLYLDGETSLKERLKITEAMNYNHGLKLVANASCLGVGVTMRSVSAVFILNIRSANTAILQQVGRALMVEENKSETHIIDISTNLRYSKKHAEKRLDLYERVYQIKISKDDIKMLKVDAKY